MPSPQESSSRQYVNRALISAEDYRFSYPGAFAAADIYAVLALPGGEVRTVGHLAAFSISTHRDTFPVTALSYVNARGFTQGHRTIAGTLMFHTIDRSAFNLEGFRGHTRVGQTGFRYGGRPLGDELPLFDLHISYVNEVGMASYETVLGIRLLDFGKSVSLENLQPVESYSYMALDYQPMTPVVSADPREEAFVLNRLGRPTPAADGSPRKTSRASDGSLIPGGP